MTPHNSIIVRLRSHQNKFTPKLRQLAEYVINNPQQVQLQSITDLASETKTSDATVFRLCKELGYSGYAQFKMALAIELSQPSADHFLDVSAFSSITQACTERAIRALKDTESLLDETSLVQAVNILNQARVVYCVGVAASSIVGRYLTYRLLRIGKSAVMYEDTHLAAMQAATPQNGDGWFIVSSSGSSKEVVHTAELAFGNNLPVISLCNVRHSPVSKVSNVVLVAANPEGPLSGGAFASKVGALLIVDTLISHMIESEPKYREKIQLTAEHTLPLIL